MSKYKVMIDPGHTAWNINQGIIPEYYEGTMAFHLACHLQEALRAYGIQADRTKKHINDGLGLNERGRMARGYDMFISLHSDACGTPSVDRCTIFRMVPDPTSDTDERSARLARMLAPVITSTMGLHDPWQVVAKHSSGDRNGDGIDNDNWMGVLHACQGVGTPGILVEHGFHTNPEVCNFLLKEENLKKLAEAEAAVIADYFGIKGFVDVPDNEYFSDAVKWAYGKGVVNGMDAHHFAPNAACTRAQAVTMLWRSQGAPEPDKCYHAFSDVLPTEYFARAVQWAYSKRISIGTGGNRFSPDDTCTRGEIVTMLWRMAGSPESHWDGFADLGPGDYFFQACNWAAKNGITKGVDEGIFAPEQPCTRGMIVTMLYRMEMRK